jgi:phosphate transport system permease protein
MTWFYVLVLALLVFSGFVLGMGRARSLVGNASVGLHSLPIYHGLFLASAIFVPMLLIGVIGDGLGSHLVNSRALNAYDPAVASDELRSGAVLREISMLASGQYSGEPDTQLRVAADTYTSTNRFVSWLLLVLGAGAGLGAFAYGFNRISGEFRARNAFERFVEVTLFICSAVAVLTTVGIVFSVLFETIRFFGKVSPVDFLFGLQWSPQTALRIDQVGSSGAFGLVPLIVGTLLITLIAMLVAGPIGLFAAIYMAEYATPRLRAVAKPILEILAGIPTVVLGFFAALTVAPAVKGWGEALGLSVASESALAAGLVMGMMIIPFVSSLSDDVINAVPQSLRDGSYAMGATKSETIKKVVLPAALPGVVSAMMLAMSRAVGETMIVVMAAGLAANLTFNPLDTVTTVTVQIKTLLVGDQEFDSAKTLSAFALGLVLFFFTLMLNVIALRIVHRYREQYD